MLFSAPFPIPTIMAVGVARPKAHGHAITKIATELRIAWDNASSPPTIIQTAKVRIEIAITVGTNIEAILSTSF